MSFCTKCGKELPENAAFCFACGAVITPAQEQEKVVAEQVVAEQVLADQIVPAEPITAQGGDADFAEEKECLDNYYKLLKWERVSWSISGKVFLILGIIFTALFGLIAILSTMVDDPFIGAFAFVYALIYALVFFPFAVVSLKMVAKTQYYMDTLYTDIRPTATRCGSVGMIVFQVFFGTASTVFFIINFVRTKANQDVIARIIRHQAEER